MNTADAIAWLDELLQQRERFKRRKTAWESEYYLDPHGGIVEWLASAEVALRSILPVSHSVVQRWAASVDQTTEDLCKGTNVDGAAALIRAARALLASGRLGSLMDGVRAETVVELLDRAAELLDEGAPLPAVVVLAGGALETHLRHLCERADPARTDVVWSKPGSIDAYKAALDRARKAGTASVSLGDTKQITAWGDRRNAAAHTPLAFAVPKDEVRTMIEHVGQFIDRTSRT